MSKEELEKEAEVFVSEKADKGNFDVEMFGKAYFSESSMKQALVKFTEPKERRIAELEENYRKRGDIIISLERQLRLNIHSDNLTKSTENKDREVEFKKELTSLLNRHGWDNACETPDHILADYVEKCLCNYCSTISRNIAWHSSWKRLGEEEEK